MKKARKYAIGGKVTKKDLDKSSMKPDDSNSFNPTSIISGISKKNVKVKKMNRGTGFYKGTENKLAKHNLKKKKLGVDKFNEKINNVAQPLIAGASLASGIASGFGGAGGAGGGMSKNLLQNLILNLDRCWQRKVYTSKRVESIKVRKNSFNIVV